MGFTEFKINRIQKFKDEETQTYTAIIEAPKGTVMLDLHDSKNRHSLQHFTEHFRVETMYFKTISHYLSLKIK